jgi:hypothetical protein
MVRSCELRSARPPYQPNVGLRAEVWFGCPRPRSNRWPRRPTLVSSQAVLLALGATEATRQLVLLRDRRLGDRRYQVLKEVLSPEE